MSELGPEVVSLVGGEIDDNQTTTRGQHRGRFADGPSGVVQKVEHLMHDDHIKGLISEHHGEIVHVALANTAVPMVIVVEAAAGHAQHGCAGIDTQAELHPIGEHLKHSPGSGPQIEEATERPRTEGVSELRFDLGLVDVKTAESVPFVGHGGKVRRSGISPILLDQDQSLPVAGKGGVGVVNQGEEGVEQLGAGSGVDRPVVGVGTFSVPLQQPRVDQEAKVAANPRLALSEDSAELGHREFSPRQDRQDAEPTWLSGGLEPLNEKIHSSEYKHIVML